MEWNRRIPNIRMLKMKGIAQFSEQGAQKLKWKGIDPLPDFILHLNSLDLGNNCLSDSCAHDSG
jgi:hypothetical protein